MIGIKKLECKLRRYLEMAGAAFMLGRNDTADMYVCAAQYTAIRISHAVRYRDLK